MVFSKKFFFILSDITGNREKNILSSHIYLLLKNNFFFPKFFILSSFIENGDNKSIFFTSDNFKTNTNYSYYEKITNEFLCRDNVFILENYYLDYLKHNINKNIYLSNIHSFIESLINKEIYENKTNESFVFEFSNFRSFIDIIPFIEMIKKIKNLFPKNVFIFYFVLIPYLNSLKEFKLKSVYNSTKELFNFFLIPDLLFLDSRYKLNNEILNNISLFTNIKQSSIINFYNLNNIYEFYDFLNKNKSINVFFKNLYILNKKHLFFNNNFYIKKNKKDFFLCYLCLEKKNLINYENILDSIFFSSTVFNINVKFSVISLIDLKNLSVFLSFDGIILAESLKGNKISAEIEVIKFIKSQNIPFLGIDYGFYVSVLEILNNFLNKEEYSRLIVNFKKKLFLGSHPIIFLNKNSFNSFFLKEINFERYDLIYVIEKKYYKYFISNFYFFRSFFLKESIVNEIFYLKSDFFLILQNHPELNSFLFKPNRIFNEFLNFLIIKKEKN